MSLSRSIAAMGILTVGLWASASVKAATQKSWTFMVYLNGDNNLDSASDLNMEQMQQVGSTDQVNVIVLRDRYSQGVTTKIYSVEKGQLKTVRDFGRNIDMGDWHTLVDFFRYSKANYPADHYVLDLWNHGSGWHSLVSSDKDISHDDHTGHMITTRQLGQALSEIKTANDGHNIDVLGTDACLMQMAEVVGEVSAFVNVVAASEEVEPDEGWDYNGALSFLTAHPTASAEEVAAHIEETYVAAYRSEVQGSAVSTLKLVAGLHDIKEFAHGLVEFSRTNRGAIQQVIGETKCFYDSDYCDFADFVHRIGSSVRDPQLTALATKAEAAVRGAVYASYATSDMAGSTGLAVWLPSSSQFHSRAAQYNDLAWTKASDWGVFLSELYK